MEVDPNRPSINLRTEEGPKLQGDRTPKAPKTPVEPLVLTAETIGSFSHRSHS